MTEIEKQHKHLITEITNELDDVRLKENEAVILYGSLSRNEGTIITQNTVFNDIDLLFLGKKLPEGTLNDLKLRLKRKFKCQFVDISFLSPHKLKKSKKRIFTYDLFQDGKVIKGNINLSKYRFDSKEISTKDVEILFRTRMWTLIGSFPETGFEELTKNEKITLNYQLSKCILACIDALAVIKKSYTSKYIDKLLWAKRQQEFSSYIDLIDFADKVKLQSKTDLAYNTPEVYYRSAMLFQIIFEMGLQKHFNSTKKITDLVNFHYKNSLKSRIMRLLYYLKGKNGNNLYNMIIIQHLIIRQVAFSENHLQNIINLCTPLGIDEKEIDKIRIRVAQIRLG